jgi:hypothetical protein
MPGWLMVQHRIAKVCFMFKIIPSSAKIASRMKKKEPEARSQKPE